MGEEAADYEDQEEDIVLVEKEGQGNQEFVEVGGEEIKVDEEDELSAGELKEIEENDNLEYHYKHLGQSAVKPEEDDSADDHQVAEENENVLDGMKSDSDFHEDMDNDIDENLYAAYASPVKDFMNSYSSRISNKMHSIGSNEIFLRSVTKSQVQRSDVSEYQVTEAVNHLEFFDAQIYSIGQKESPIFRNIAMNLIKIRQEILDILFEVSEPEHMTN